MSQPAAAPAVAEPVSTEETSRWQIGVFAAAFLFLWFEVIRHLSAEWSFNAQYSYGWAVPFLAVFLLWQRWSKRPPPRPPDSKVWPITLISFCAFLFLPIRFIAEANPDWRLLSWALGLAGVIISICFVFLVGGSPWARHFAFPFLFILVAVPWPALLEQTVIQGLMRAVTAIIVSVLNIVGVPALQHGNVIEVSAGLIGIEEACSGVRSLQATLMISLFLGELYSFTVRRRVFLVIAGGVLAFVSNLVRTAILVWVGSNRGPGSIEGWHDPAGLTILLICLFALWFVSLLIRRHSNGGMDSAWSDDRSAFQAPGHAALRNPLPAGGQGLQRLSGPLVALAIWLFLAEAAVQVWYGVHRSPASLRWLVSWPVSEAEYKSVPIAREAEDMLRYNEGGGATWATEGHRWMMYFFRWLPGQTAARFVKVHRPDICLPASGLTMARDNGIRMIAVNGVNLPLRSYRFDDNGVPLHVFYCYWDGRSSYQNVAAAVEEDWTPRGRLRAALHGRREIGAQMLEVVVWGYENDAEAESRMIQQLGQIIRPS